MRSLLQACAALALSAHAAGCGAPRDAPQAAPPPAAPSTPAPARPAAEKVLVRDFFVADDRLAYEGYEVLRRERPVRVEHPPEVRPEPETVEVSYAVLRRGGRVLARFEGTHGAMGNETGFGLFPLLGGGGKQLVVSQTVPRGGRHWVVDLSAGFRVIHDSAEYGLGREDLSALDVDGDGVYELSQELTTFVFFEGLTGGASHVVDILLRYDPRARKYVPASHVFADYTLGGVRAEGAGLDRGDARALASDVLRVMLPYIYAGRRAEAWAFYDREYTPPDKQELKSKIAGALARDPVYNFIYPEPRPAGPAP